MKRLKVAAIATSFYYRSHAHVILENFLEPYLFRGEVVDPGMDVVSLHCDQFPAKDMARDTAKRYGVPLFPTIAEALRVGGDALAVDAVLSIGEHGDYPKDERGVVMYPRKRFFDEIVAVFKKDGRTVPVFNDKHLSYRWDWADEMVRTAGELGFPLMAGSSVPLAQRRPEFEFPVGAEIEEAVAVHGGPPEIYDFHGLEVLQAMIEARQGGESGVAKIEWLEGDDVWKAAAAGRWSLELADRAVEAHAGKKVGPLSEFVEPKDGERHKPHAILIEYRDGLRATVLRIGYSGTRWGFACRVKGKPEPLATSHYVGPWENRNLFKALSHAIQVCFREGRWPYPVERTLLVTGMLASAMDARSQGKSIATPHLGVAYESGDWRALRENGESWKVVTESTPQTQGIDSAKFHLPKR